MQRPFTCISVGSWPCVKKWRFNTFVTAGIRSTRGIHIATNVTFHRLLAFDKHIRFCNFFVCIRIHMFIIDQFENRRNPVLYPRQFYVYICAAVEPHPIDSSFQANLIWINLENYFLELKIKLRNSWNRKMVSTRLFSCTRKCFGFSLHSQCKRSIPFFSSTRIRYGKSSISYGNFDIWIRYHVAIRNLAIMRKLDFFSLRVIQSPTR